MGRNLSPVLHREFANLEKGADSRKSAMKALKSYVKDLDSKSIPLFLSQVSQNKVASPSGAHMISLYEVLAKVHGPSIVSQIDIIMGTILRTLATSAGSFPLQQACSKVVPAIAQYGIEPTTPEDKKLLIIHSLCKPLADSLLGAQESLSSGAALCLRALVGCDNWRFASNDMLHDVCQKLAGALRNKVTQTNAHIGLVTSLAKHNTAVVEIYASFFIRCGLKILNAGVVDKNSQERLEAIQMISFLMKCLDIGSIFSELELVAEEMEKCQFDQVSYVGGAAFEALQTANKLISLGKSKFETDLVSESGSNFGRSGKIKDRYRLASGDWSSLSVSPESQTLNSSADFDSLFDSSISSNEASCDVSHDNNYNTTRRLWNYANGGDIPLKDGLFSEIMSKSGSSHVLSKHIEHSCSRAEYSSDFSGFVFGGSSEGILTYQTPSPQVPRKIDTGSIKIYSTPRKLVQSLQEDYDEKSDFYMKQLDDLRSSFSGKCGCSPGQKCNQNGDILDNEATHVSNNDSRNLTDKEELSCESVSSTDARVKADSPVSESVLPDDGKERKTQVKFGLRASVNMFLAIWFLLVAVFTPLMWFGAEEEGYHHLVPT